MYSLMSYFDDNLTYARYSLQGEKSHFDTPIVYFSEYKR